MFHKKNLTGPVFYKDDSDAERQLEALIELRKSASGKAAQALDLELRLVQAGIAGEKQVHFELENSHIPMYVLHDLYLEHEGLTAQIDYLIITSKYNYVIECKNLYGDIEINANGDFIRTFSYGHYKKKEGVYSPITQNRRHLDLIKQMRNREKNALQRLFFEKYFFDNYRSVVVLANPKTVLNARYAKKEVRDQVIRADQLIDYIRKIDANRKDVETGEKQMEELAAYFLSVHQTHHVDYMEHYRSIAKDAEKREEAMQSTSSKEAKTQDQLICPKCGAPMVKRKAKRGDYIGNVFYGCSRYPQCRGIINVK